MNVLLSYINQHIIFLDVSHRRAAKAETSRRYSYTKIIDVCVDSDQNLDLMPSWIRQHGRLKEAFVICDEYQNLNVLVHNNYFDWKKCLNGSSM